MAEHELAPAAQMLLTYWFDELDDEAWWKPSSAVDAEIRKLFYGLYEDVVRNGVPLDWLTTPTGRLAAIIVLDQLPRNLHRGDARAFASDDLALAIAKRSIESGDEAGLDERQRIFLYMPFQHSEDKAVQVRSVELFAAMGNEKNSRFAQSHKDVIDRFGRFPHRNKVLGRVSTPEEIEFLENEAPAW